MRSTLDKSVRLPSRRQGAIDFMARGCILTIVYVYRFTLSPLIGGQCRYQPTCSQYMLDAVEKFGPWRGGWRGLKRFCRCHPWGGSGHDPA